MPQTPATCPPAGSWIREASKAAGIPVYSIKSASTSNLVRCGKWHGVAAQGAAGRQHGVPPSFRAAVLDTLLALCQAAVRSLRKKRPTGSHGLPTRRLSPACAVAGRCARSWEWTPPPVQCSPTMWSPPQPQTPVPAPPTAARCAPRRASRWLRRRGPALSAQVQASGTLWRRRGWQVGRCCVRVCVCVDVGGAGERRRRLPQRSASASASRTAHRRIVSSGSTSEPLAMVHTIDTGWAATTILLFFLSPQPYRLTCTPHLYPLPHCCAVQRSR